MAKDKTEIENYYFIDFQNVTKDGLDGLDALGKNDCVRVYYGKNAAHIPFDLHIRIHECQAAFEYEKVEYSIKNALDCMIIYDIRAFAGVRNVRNYYIVSNDTDFDEPIRSFSAAGLKICRIPSIKDTPKTVIKKNDTASGSKKTKEKKCENKVRTFYEQNFKEKKYKQKKELVVPLIISSQDRGELNNKLQKLFDGSDVKMIMKTIKPLTNELYKKK